ncbi:hypothetical protein RCIA83 [Methanocella arvoryzae MRE50]|uniref:Uncharacterized protein n=1 Tax=Methanocella arvoryzae (strain DSM 22066 / NBRC 105507 / MRE50) TaxID=351160 RepID=Q0W531_METAR|nr:hypothetical protein RCIA83 [Methanocella arvoryzae MRE50]
MDSLPVRSTDALTYILLNRAIIKRYRAEHGASTALGLYHARDCFQSVKMQCYQYFRLSSHTADLYTIRETFLPDGQAEELCVSDIHK